MPSNYYKWQFVFKKRIPNDLINIILFLMMYIIFINYFEPYNYRIIHPLTILVVQYNFIDFFIIILLLLILFEFQVLFT